MTTATRQRVADIETRAAHGAPVSAEDIGFLIRAWRGATAALAAERESLALAVDCDLRPW